jgi:probable lipoprotein (TIGR04455 family)
VIRLAALLAVLALGAACSSVDHDYLLAGYNPVGPDAVKRVVVAGWAPEPGVAELAARIATDMVRLHKNYLAYDPAVLAPDYGASCTNRQGVLVMRVLDLVSDGGEVLAHAAAELYRCKDGRLLWRSEGTMSTDSDDEDLQQLVYVYKQQLGPAAQHYAAPLFALFKELLADLPNPELSEDEVLEKIELGARPHPGDLLARRPFDSLRSLRAYGSD